MRKDIDDLAVTVKEFASDRYRGQDAARDLAAINTKVERMELREEPFTREIHSLSTRIQRLEFLADESRDSAHKRAVPPPAGGP